MSAPLLKVNNLKKAYGAIQAVGGVSFEVMPGERPTSVSEDTRTGLFVALVPSR